MKLGVTLIKHPGGGRKEVISMGVTALGEAEVMCLGDRGLPGGGGRGLPGGRGGGDVPGRRGFTWWETQGER